MVKMDNAIKETHSNASDVPSYMQDFLKNFVWKFFFGGGGLGGLVH
jgi:hypothetical protein